MKKYLVTLAAMALAMGGSINFVGCGGEDFTIADPVGPKRELDDKGKADAEKEGYIGGPTGGSQADDGGGKKED